MVWWRQGCAEAGHLLQGALEGTLQPLERDRLRRHLNGCRSCREEVVVQAQVDRALRPTARDEPTPSERTPTCAPDEVLAGFADRTLPEADRQEWSAHVSDCACTHRTGSTR